MNSATSSDAGAMENGDDYDEHTPTAGEHTLAVTALAIDCAAELAEELRIPLSPNAVEIVKSWMLATARIVRTTERREYDRLYREMEQLEARFAEVVRQLTLARNAMRRD